MVEYALHYEMTSQISGPCYDSDIELDPCKRFVWESHVRQKIYQGYIWDIEISEHLL